MTLTDSLTARSVCASIALGAVADYYLASGLKDGTIYSGRLCDLLADVKAPELWMMRRTAEDLL